MGTLVKSVAKLSTANLGLTYMSSTFMKVPNRLNAQNATRLLFVEKTWPDILSYTLALRHTNVQFVTNPLP